MDFFHEGTLIYFCLLSPELVMLLHEPVAKDQSELREAALPVFYCTLDTLASVPSGSVLQ